MTGATAQTLETTFWHPEGFTGLELERTPRTAQPVASQLLGDYCLSLCLQGPASIQYRREKHALKGGTFQSYGAGEVLTAAPQKGGRWGYQTLRVSPDLMRDLTGAARIKRLPFTVPISSDAALNHKLGELFTDAFSSLARGAPSLESEAKLVAVVRALARHQDRPPRPQTVTPRTMRAVEVVKAHLTEHFSTPLSLDQIAELVNMSKFHLSRTFKEVVGVTPAVFGMSLRVREAKRLLRREPIAHVAFDLGFADQAHFTRTFKRYVGVTPGQYAALRLES